MKEKPITEVLSHDALLWLLFVWFTTRDDPRTYGGQRAVTSETYQKLEKKWLCRARATGGVREFNSEISSYFKSLLPLVFEDIKSEEVHGNP